MAIFQDLVDQHGFAGQYKPVKRFVAKLRRKEPEQFDRRSFLPGEEVQVDCGEGTPTRVPGSDRYRKPRLFVATLHCSRASFRRVVWKSGQQVWAGRHAQPRRLPGIPVRTDSGISCGRQDCARLARRSPAHRIWRASQPVGGRAPVPAQRVHAALHGGLPVHPAVRRRLA
jgi:hypothetical protein